MKRIFLLFLTLGVFFLSKSQNLSTSDSLSGFDEIYMNDLAINKGVTLEELPYFLQFQKREFIKSKYNLKSEPVNNKWYHEGLSKIAVAYCQNEDFENSVPTSTASVPKMDTIKTTNGINGWVALSGLNTSSVGSCVITSTCCLNPPNAVYVIGHDTSGYIDPLVGTSYPIFSVFGDSLNKGSTPYYPKTKGKYFLKLNNQSAGSGANLIAKSFTVTPSNSLFTFASLVVSQAQAHCCCESAGAKIALRDCSGNLLATPQFSIMPMQYSSTVCPGTKPCDKFGTTVTYTNAMMAGWVKSKWNIGAVDLTPYIGNCITIEYYAIDCPYAGHAGYAFFDSQCDSMYVLRNSARVSAVSNSITINSCSNVMDTLTAPPGLAPYGWVGPGPFGASNSQSITTNYPGTYTLTLSGMPLNTPTYKYITITHSVISIPVTTSNSIICQGNSSTLNAYGASTYTWNTGSNSASITVTPSITTTYSVNGTDAYGCAAKGVITQSVALCTGINATTEYLSNFNIHPNPNHGEFVITNNTSSKNLRAEIYNALGQIVLIKQLEVSRTNVNMQEQSSGLYFVKLFEDGKLVYATKLIKTEN